MLVTVGFARGVLQSVACPREGRSRRVTTAVTTTLTTALATACTVVKPTKTVALVALGLVAPQAFPVCWWSTLINLILSL